MTGSQVLGIAYSPLGNNRLVFRASYSITHIPMNPIQGLINVGRNYPSFYLQTASSPTQPILDLSRPFASAIVPSPTFQAADPHLRNAYIQQRAVSLQYEFLRSWSIELAYQGRKTTRFLRQHPGERSAARQLWRADPAAAPESEFWPIQHPVKQRVAYRQRAERPAETTPDRLLRCGCKLPVEPYHKRQLGLGIR